MHKIIFYGAFIAMGVFWAEVTSSNIPLGLINPLLYLAYGLLYIFFIDGLMRWEGKIFSALYMFGMLVGLITETYVAKVTFYGLKPDAGRILGIAPGAIMFVILFYHAYFSFLLPLYLSKRILNMPLNLDIKRRWDIFVFLAPLIISPIIAVHLTGEGKTVGILMAHIAISGIVLALWVLLLRWKASMENVLLSKRQRLGLLVFTLLAYVLFLFKATNKVHGHAPMDFPIPTMLVVTFIIVGLLWITFKSLGKNGKERQKVSYCSKTISLPLFFCWLVWHIGSIGLFLILQLKNPFLKQTLVLLAIAGVITGVGSFLGSLFYLLKSLRKQFF